MNLILIRGLPGSGKSTLAKDFVKLGYVHFEADMWFEKDGVYKFNPAEIKDAHQACMSNTESCLKNGISVVVSNTFTRLSEMHFYMLTAKEYKYNVYIVKATGNYPDVHGVPSSTKEKMSARWQPV